MLLKLKADAYQALYFWALRRWRKTTGRKYIKGYREGITRHAIERYFERIENRDIQNEIMTTEVKSRIAELGGTGKFIENNILYFVDKGVIFTIARPNPGQAHTSGLSKDTSTNRKWSF